MSDFDRFLYHYNRRRGNDDLISCVNRRGFVTGEEQPYLHDRTVKPINDSFDKLSYQKKKEIAQYHKNKEKK